MSQSKAGKYLWPWKTKLTLTRHLLLLWRSVADKVIPMVKTCENIIHKLKLVNYIKCCKKVWLEICKIYVHEWKKYYANVMTTNTNQNCEIWVEKKERVEKERTLTSCVVSQWLHLTEMRLRSKVAVPWLLNTADFFFFLAGLIEDSERQLSSASYDSLQYQSYFGALTKQKDTPSCNSVVKVKGRLEIVKFTLWVWWSNRKGVIIYIITGHTSIP